MTFLLIFYKGLILLMGKVLLKNMCINTRGCLPNVGDMAHRDFILMSSDFSTCSLSDFRGKQVLINVYPGVDSPSGLNSIKKCNDISCDFPDLVVLCISIDLPFTLKRVKEENDFNNVLLLSDYKNRSFGDLYGLTMIDGPIAGMLSSCAIVLDPSHHISYVKISPDISKAPNFLDAIDTIIRNK